MVNTHQICLAAQPSLGFIVLFKNNISAEMMYGSLRHVAPCSKDDSSIVNRVATDTESRKMMFYCRASQKGHINAPVGLPCSVLIEMD